MTNFDNGPPDGDFVRYIEALVATRAAALANTDQKLAASVVPIPRTHAASTVPSFVTPMPPRSATVRAPAMQGSTLTPAQAATVAATMMRSGATGARSMVAIVALLLGVALLIAGWVGAAFNAPLVFVGGALVYWAVKGLAGSGSALPRRRP